MADPLGYAGLLALGGIAGFTIFLGLPLALVQNLASRTKAFLNSVATGIIVFLLLEIVPKAKESTEMAFRGSAAGNVPITSTVISVAVLLLGFASGLVGLAWYEGRFMKRVAASNQNGVNGEFQPSNEFTRRLAMMIAVGLGLHNFSEGLAIGQEYVNGAVSLAVLLIIGFALHNATEGFGIAAPVVGQKVGWPFIVSAGVVAGGPTFLGTVVGSLWASPIVDILFLSLAGGALLYVIVTMYGVSRRQISNLLLTFGVFTGFSVAYFTELLLVFSGL